MKSPPLGPKEDFRIVTKERLMGSTNRWRRYEEPTPAGHSRNESGSPDFGIFGPDSVVWEVLLHPATIVFQFTFQGLIQASYKPIYAGVRDVDPMARNARKNTLTAFDVFERGQRNSGMHAPMWLGDSKTAKRMADFLHNVHKKVKGDVIDVGQPELGGYAASNPRDAMWAALTEMHSMLWLYESFAFRGGWLPRKLPAEKRDKYISEVAAYCLLVGAEKDEIPHTMDELKALYKKYEHLWGSSDTIKLFPDTGENWEELVTTNIKKNFHRSQIGAAFYAFVLDHGIFRQLAAGASSAKLRENIGMGSIRSAVTVFLSKAALPLIWLLQRGPFERKYMRLMWGPDGVMLIKSARELRSEIKRMRRKGS